MQTNTKVMFTLLALSAVSGIAEADVFLESGGRVIIEVESAPIADGWSDKSEITGFTGTGYYEWTGPNHFNVASAGDGAITYTFRISTPGNYQLVWRSRIGSGELSTESNDSWVRLATGTDVVDAHPLDGWTKAYMNQLHTWSWTTKTVDGVGEPLRQYYDVGDHTVEISGRSTGHLLDRIALFNYDTVGFNISTFESLPESETVDGTVDPVDPTVEGPDWSVTQTTLAANECAGDVLSLAPDSDIYSANGIVSNADELKVNSIDRKILLKFDLATVPPITDATFRFTTGTDNGNGTLILSTGSHSNWSEADASLASGPDNSALLGTYSGPWNTDSRYGFPFNAEILGNSQETLIIDMDAGGNDMAMLSREVDNGPRLEVAGNVGFCVLYEQLVAEALLVEELPVEPENTVAEETPQEVLPPEEGRTSAEIGTGRTSYISLILLGLYTLAFRAMLTIRVKPVRTTRF